MNRFKNFFLVESTVNSLIANSQARCDIKNGLYCLQEFANDKFLKRIILEAKEDAKSKSSKRAYLSKSHRRYLSPAEEELYTRYRMSGDSGPEAQAKLMAEKGQLPAVRAWLKALGLDQDHLLKIRRGETKDSIDFGDMTSDKVRDMMKSQGIKDILPDSHWKEVLEKQVLRTIRDKAKSGIALTSKERSLYDAWKEIVASYDPIKLQSGKTVRTLGNTKQDMAFNRPADAVGPEDYDDLWLRISGKYPDIRRDTKDDLTGHDRFQKAAPQDMDKRRLYKQIASKPTHLAHYDPLLESNDQIFPDEIALNIDDTWAAMKQKGIEILSKDEAELMYLDKIKNDILAGRAFVPNTDTKDQSRRYGRWDQSLTGTAGASTGISNPVTNPGDLQVLTGKVRDIKDKKFGDLKTWGEQPPGEKPLNYAKLPKDLQQQYIALNKERSAFPDPKINDMYRKDQDLFEEEMLKVARKAAYMFFDEEDARDASQEIAMMMLQATGLDGWRESEALRFTWAKLYAWRYREQLKKFNQQRAASQLGSGNEEDGPDAVSGASGSGLSGKPGDYTDKQRKDIRRSTFDLLGDEDSLERMGLDSDDIEELQQASKNLKQAISEKDAGLAKRAVSTLMRIANDYPELEQIVNMMLNPESI